MSGFPVRDARRRSSAFVSCAVFVGATGLVLSACSGNREVAQEVNSPIAIETSQISVTIENKAGVPLIDVNVAILPAGLLFIHRLSRLEIAEKRDLSLSDFASRDGTTFSLRLVRPKTVRVTATDLANKKYEVEVAWK